MLYIDYRHVDITEFSPVRKETKEDIEERQSQFDRYNKQLLTSIEQKSVKNTYYKEKTKL